MLAVISPQTITSVIHKNNIVEMQAMNRRYYFSVVSANNEINGLAGWFSWDNSLNREDEFIFSL